MYYCFCLISTVLSAYTPATVALQDLLRSQLALTERLINQSRTLSEHMSANVTANYQYVTLDQTKQVPRTLHACVVCLHNSILTMNNTHCFT